MWKVTLVSLLSLASCGLASPVRSAPSQIHEAASNIAFKRLEPIAPDAIIPIRVGLTQTNLAQGYDYVMNVSDPASKSYGKYWSREQVNAVFAPSSLAQSQVQEWLFSAGISNARQSTDEGWFAFETSAQQAEQLLNAKYYEYENPRDGTVRIGCEQYSLPSHISPHVDYITPAVTLSGPVKRSRIPLSRSIKKQFASVENFVTAAAAQLPTDLQQCNQNITPPCLRALYDIPLPSANLDEGILGIFEEGDVYAQEDLDLFFKNYAPYVPNGTHPILISINNASAPVNASDYADGGESDIDFDLAYSILGAVNITLYQTQDPLDYNGSSTLVDSLLDAVDASFCTPEQQSGGFQCGGDNLTTVLSGSYSSPELFEESRASQERACNEFMKLSLQGHTILYSSGDYGVASNPFFGSPLCGDDGCIPADLQMGPYYYFNGPIFSPGFPANCPYVLTVGATMVVSNATVYDPESVMYLPGLDGCDDGGKSVFSSSGGFSNYFARPQYQDDAVNNYLSKNDPGYAYYEANDADVTSNATNIGANNGIYNRPGRAFPDVSANGAHLSTFIMGKPISQEGTSLATPIWASLIALINQQRADAGQPPVGFIHPVLYAHPEVFHDITNGTNPGCGTQGFPAAEGWDPSTGLGTPNFPALAALFQNITSS